MQLCGAAFLHACLEHRKSLRGQECPRHTSLEGHARATASNDEYSISPVPQPCRVKDCFT